MVGITASLHKRYPRSTLRFSASVNSRENAFTIPALPTAEIGLALLPVPALNIKSDVTGLLFYSAYFFCQTPAKDEVRMPLKKEIKLLQLRIRWLAALKLSEQHKYTETAITHFMFQAFSRLNC